MQNWKIIIGLLEIWFLKGFVYHLRFLSGLSAPQQVKTIHVSF